MLLRQKIWILANSSNASVFGYLMSAHGFGWLLILLLVAFGTTIWGYSDVEEA